MFVAVMFVAVMFVAVMFVAAMFVAAMLVTGMFIATVRMCRQKTGRPAYDSSRSRRHASVSGTWLNV